MDPLRWTIVFVTVVIATSTALECTDLEAESICSCYEYDTTDIQCPEVDPNIRISVSKNSHVVVQCYEDQSPQLDLDNLPSVNISQAKYFKLQFCFLHNTFADILEKFHIRDLEMLTFESLVHPNADQQITISRQSLDSLQSLEGLSLSYSSIVLTPDFLASTPNLLTLTLYKNSLTELDRYFEYVPKLKLLDISGNYIDTLPDSIFDRLSNLTKLLLFSNNLTTLSNMTFSGLDNLKLLELSHNHIQYLPEDCFAGLRQLVNVSLRGNQIKIIYSRTFSNNPQLQNIRMSSNPGLILEDGVFGNLTLLRTVELSFNKLNNIHENTFENCHELEEINLNGNQLTTLPEKLFKDLKKLKILNLSNNKLSLLPDGIFTALQKLKVLNLNNNILTTISGKLFNGLYELEKLELQKNLITDIDRRSFITQGTLTFLDLSFNQWNNSYDIGTFGLDVSPLDALGNIEVLLLRHNELTHVPSLLSLLGVRNFDLSYNKVDSLSISDYVQTKSRPLDLNLSYNKLEVIDFNLAELIFNENLPNGVHYDGAITTINVSGNPILCDCDMYELSRYNNNDNNLKILVNIVQDGVVCANDNQTSVLDVKPKHIKCPVTEGCPSSCKCDFKPLYNAMEVNCSSNHLRSYPELSFPLRASKVNRVFPKFNQTFLILRGNNLTHGPTGSEENYSNVTVMDLSKNAISEISWIPAQIVELNLEENLLKNIDGKMIGSLKNATYLQRLTLKNNPWHCSCKSADLQKYLIQHYIKVNSSEVYCQNLKMELVKKTDLCKVSPYLSILLPIILAVLLMFALTFALYYRYQTEVKVYLFAKNLCLWFVTEEELDKDKNYDVFISFAHQDEKFVLEQLLPELENNKEHPYKVCIHTRDWVPGEFISEQVVDSVVNSRRTLVVLSDHFINSVWGKLEFRTAHTQAISEGRARVIVVIYGDFDESKLDDELKSYLKTNTYVKWGDRYFWNKLKYALPHSRRNYYEANKKHARVMLKIDDKFDLIKNPPSPTNTSTPPITLDPALLQGKHLALDLDMKIEGEDPLLAKNIKFLTSEANNPVKTLSTCS